MTATNVTTWAITTDHNGSPVIIASEPNEEDARSALALVRVNPAARRYCVEPVGIVDDGFVARLARETVAMAFQDGADWHRVRPGDLLPEPVAEPAPKRRDRAAMRPGDPGWAAEAMTLLELGYPDPEEREAARERMIPRALAERWTLKQLGQEIQRELAEEQDARHVCALHVIDMGDPIAARFGKDDSARVWQKVIRPPREGEVSNVTRGGF